MAVDDPAQKAEPFSHVVPVMANVVFHDTPVDGEKLGHAGGPGKKIGGMAKLRRLHDYCLRKIEDVFRPKQVQAASTLAELPVVEGIIIWLPCDVRDVEIARNAQRSAESLQVSSLNRCGFDARANLIEGLGKLTEAVVGLARFGDLFSNVCGKRDFDAARQSGLPLDQMPGARMVLVFAALCKSRPDADFGAEQMIPLVPTRIPK